MKPLIDRITQGPVAMHPQFFTIIDQQGAHVADCDGTHEIDDETRRANAEFITEAFTVAHEMGLTPRQMADESVKFRASAKRMDDLLCEIGRGEHDAPADPQPVLPPGLPPLPPGTRYGGQLKDYEGRIAGYVWRTNLRDWQDSRLHLPGTTQVGMLSSDWHLAIPLDA